MKTIYKIFILTVIACSLNYGFLFSETLLLKPLDNENFVSNSNKEILNSGTFYQLDYTIVYQNQSNNWVNYNKINYIYNSEYFLIEDNKEVWQANDWASNEMNLYSYGVNNKLSERTYKKKINNEWTNVNRWLIDYDYDNRKFNETKQRWDSSWVNDTKDFYYYDSKGNNDFWLRQRWLNGNWVDMSRDSAFFNEKNQQISDYYQNWLGIEWINEEKGTIEYDASGNIIIQTFYVWTSDSTWLMNVRYIYTYDENSRQTEFIRETLQNDTMIADIKLLDNYDINGNRIVRLRQGWDGEKWIDALKYEYFYKTITSIEENNDLDDIRIRPNPLSDNSKIEFELENPSIVKIMIYNELGCELFQIANAEYPAGSIIINLNEYVFQSGMYFLRIQIGKNLKIIPILKL